MRNKTLRCLLILAALLILLSALLSYMFLSAGSLHHCTGEDCEICLSLSFLRKALECLLLVVFAAALCSLILKKLNDLESQRQAAAFPSLVSLKVKLSN